jgi:predicted S18 family serine protease
LQRYSSVFNLRQLLEDSGKYSAALANYEAIFSMQSKSTSPSSVELIKLGETISKLCVRAINEGDRATEFKRAAISYARTTVSLVNNTTSGSLAYYKRHMAAQVQLWRTYLAMGNWGKALIVVNRGMMPISKTTHGKFSLSFIACLIRRASTKVQMGDIEAALNEIFKVCHVVY